VQHRVAEPVQQSEEVKVEDIIGQQDSDIEEEEEENQEEVAGPSIGHKRTREKCVAPRTPTKHKDLTLSLQKILDGVRIVGDMLGYVNKLRYSNHDVKDMEKFPKFAQQGYMERKGEVPSGDPILEPKQWIAGTL
jgi:hypothetical protein